MGRKLILINILLIIIVINCNSKLDNQIDILFKNELMEPLLFIPIINSDSVYIVSLLSLIREMNIIPVKDQKKYVKLFISKGVEKNYFLDKGLIYKPRSSELLKDTLMMLEKKLSIDKKIYLSNDSLMYDILYDMFKNNKLIILDDYSGQYGVSNN